jgi:hypothetical protein
VFNPNLEIGEEIKNSRLCSIFGCSPQGGMRKSNKTNTLVIVTDYTRGIYHDKWIGGILHYTGMGLIGDQDINYMQNKTLNESSYNGVDVHLFEVMEPGVYTYCGRVHLVGNPYTEIQPGQDGQNRKVWMFPVQPIPDNDVKKPKMYVFKDMDDYKSRGANVDREYAAYLASIDKKKSSGTRKVGSGLIGKKIKHKVFGTGTITKYDGTIITVKFERETKTLNYQHCIANLIIEIL